MNDNLIEMSRINLNDSIRRGIVIIQFTNDYKLSFTCSATESEIIVPLPITEKTINEIYHFNAQNNMTIMAQRKIETWLAEKSGSHSLKKQNNLFIKTIHELSKER